MFGVAVEINSRLDRADPPPELLLLANEIGCLFAVDSDAHTTGQLSALRHGVARAAEAGIRPDRIITTWPVEDLLRHAARRRDRAVD